MGQANQRGNFAERQQRAYDNVEMRDAARAENLAALEATEKQSDDYMKVAVSQMITRYWRETNLAARIPAATFEVIDPKVLVVAQGDLIVQERHKLLVEAAA